MNLISIAVGLMIVGIISFYELRGGVSSIKQANVTAVETQIQTLRQAAIQYGEINGSYSGLSCIALQNANLLTGNGACDPSNSLSLASPYNNAGLLIIPAPCDNGAHFTISVSNFFDPTTYSMMASKFVPGTSSTSTGCSTSESNGTGLTLCY